MNLHAILSFNLLRPSRVNPKLSSYAPSPRRFLIQAPTTHATRHQGTSARANIFRSEVLSGVFNSAVFASFWRSSPGWSFAACSTTHSVALMLCLFTKKYSLGCWQFFCCCHGGRHVPQQRHFWQVPKLVPCLLILRILLISRVRALKHL